MEATKKKYEWTDFLGHYSEVNTGRLTRLGVFEEESGFVNDYWIEAGLPLKGLNCDTSGGDAPTIEIMLGESFSHPVRNVRTLKLIFSFDENSDGIDIVGGDGRTTVLRYEN